MTIRLWTIGQGARPDLLAECKAALSQDIPVEILGVLDGLDDREIADMAPKPGEEALFTTLAGGKRAIVGKLRIGNRLRGLLAAKDMLSGTNILACTSDFANLADSNLIMPSQILPGLTRAIAGRQSVGVLVPLPDHIPEAEACWAREEVGNVKVFALRPDAPDDVILQAASEMGRYEPSLVLCDCFSYSSRTKALLMARLGCSVIVPVTLMIRLAEELELPRLAY